MRRMLEELYFRNINPNDKQFIRGSKYDKAIHILSENEEKLALLLEGREKKLFLHFVNAQGLVDGMTAVESFISSFWLGASVTIEIMNEEDGCLRDITQTAVFHGL